MAIDTATRACSVALFENDTCIGARHQVIGRGHAERLVPMIAELPDRGQADAIHVNVGPGSFTGIRVGISAARALGLAWRAECHGYGSLDLVAAMAVQQACPDADFSVVMIGGHGEYFVQRFDQEGRAISDNASIAIAEAVASISDGLIVGDAAEAFVEARGRGDAVQLLPDAAQWILLAGRPLLPPSARYGREADAKPPKAMQN